MKCPPAYELCSVAFLDILGFSSLVSSFKENPESRFALHEALDCFKRARISAGSSFGGYQSLRVSTFSDSIVLSCPSTHTAMLINACGLMQSELLAGGFASRGGIAKGFLHHEDDVMYGEGMIKAYDLERKCANNPRVIIDADLVDEIHPQSSMRNHIKLDSDGLWFIDFFGINPFNYNETLIEDGWHPELLMLNEIRPVIAKNLTELKCSRHRDKWVWLAERFNESMEQFRDWNHSSAQKIVIT